MKVQFKGRTLEISEGKQAYWLMDAEYHKCLKAAEENFKKAYKSTGNLKNLLDKFWDVVELVEIESYDMLSGMLKKYGGLGISSDEFYNAFGENFETKFEKYEEELIKHYNHLVDSKEAKYQYRKDRKASRRRWYGFTQEGQNRAAIKNMESYMWHSTKNLVGNAVTATATSIKMGNVFNDKKRMNLMCADIRLLYSNIRTSMYTTMQKHSNYPFQVITNADVDNANMQMELAKESKVNSEDNINAVVKALETHPGLISIYQYIIQNYGDSDKELENLASKFGISLEAWKINKLKDKLKVCTPKDLSDEEKILAAIKLVEDECCFWGMEPDEYTKELQGKWSVLDKKLRTVENVEYQTREEADNAKQDVKYLEMYSAQNNILDIDTETLSEIILPELKCESIKNNIKYGLDMLKASQDIRNIQSSAKRVMSYFTAYDKVTKCFAYGHIFSQKIGYERFQELFNDNKKVALIYDTAAVNKGVNGLLLTNTTLYYYQEHAIKEIALDKYIKMQVRAGKIYIQIEGEGELNTGLDVNVDQLDYIFFAETFDKVVQMCRCIKNGNLELKDEEIYDNVIIRSKQAEFVRHNKLVVVAVVAVFVFILMSALANIIPGKTEVVNTSGTVSEEVSKEVAEEHEVNEIGNATEPAEVETLVDTSDSWNIYYGEEIINFLKNSDSGCWYANENGLYTYHGITSGLDESGEVRETGYTIVDMDSDEKPEVIISLSGQLDDYYMILHYNDQSEDFSIYAMTVGTRGLQMLQVNGVFMGSSGASSTGYYMYDFESGMNCYQIELAYIDSENYSIQSIPVSKDEFDAYYESTLKADLVEWRDYSLSGLAEELGVSVTEEVESMNFGITDYVLEGSSAYLLDWSEIDGLTAEECKIARNEIYARHGRLFNDAELQAYFDACPWYEGYISAEDFSEDMLSDVEKANRDLIIEYEIEMGYR